jgi:hypothetical protein
MRVNTNVFWVLAAFFWIETGVYTVWSLFFSEHDRVEWVGTIGMGLAGVLFVFLAFYLGRTHVAQGGEGPADLPNANIDDGDPEIGYFSPWSWWPFTLGLALALVMLGLAVGIWITFIGVPLVIVGVIGWYYEYYRSNFAR